MEAHGRPQVTGFGDLLAAGEAMSAAERTERLRQIELQQRTLDAEVALLVELNDADGEHGRDGHRSTAGYLRAHLNCSGGRVMRMRRCGRLVRRHAEVGEALWSGRIGLDQTAELARAFANPRCGHLLGESFPILLGHAERLKFDEFRLVVRRWEMLADLNGAHRDRGDAVDSRRARVIAGNDGVDLTATGGTALQAAQMQAILDAYAEAEFRADQHDARDRFGDDVTDADLPRTHGQRVFDALVRIFDEANTCDRAGTPHPVTVDVVIDQYSFENQLAQHGLAACPTDLVAADPAARRSHTETGLAVHPEEVLAAALTGHVRRVVVDSKGVVIDLGQRSRLFTGSAAEAARLFATVCELPGCTLPEAWCQVDHMAEWEDGGLTVQSNAAIACGHQNRAKHRHKWRTRRDRAGRVQVRRADGTWITPVGADPPVGDCGLDEALYSDLRRRGFTVLTSAA